MKVEEMVPMAKTNEKAQPLIHVKNLHKSFGDQIVLNGIELGFVRLIDCGRKRGVFTEKAHPDVPR